jgi:hypothetical protein
MSIDYHVYAGPYVACKVCKVQGTHKVLTCTTPGCRNTPPPGSRYGNLAASARFCPLCGAATLLRADPIQVDDVNRNDVEVVLKGKLRVLRGFGADDDCEQRGIHVYLSNQCENGPRQWSFCPEEETVFQPVSAADVLAELEHFAFAFKAEIAELRRLYGTANVTILWGVISWAN